MQLKLQTAFRCTGISLTALLPERPAKKLQNKTAVGEVHAWKPSIIGLPSKRQSLIPKYDNAIQMPVFFFFSVSECYKKHKHTPCWQGNLLGFQINICESINNRLFLLAQKTTCKPLNAEHVGSQEFQGGNSLFSNGRFGNHEE
ncbi:hypothetical protein FKM82_021462 [Ascaphus truei]